MALKRVSILFLALAALAGCRESVQTQVPEVIRTLPHDRSAFTQGFLLHQGRFYESTGRYGESTLREVDLETGAVLRSVHLDERYFGEGLALMGDELVQITWQEGVAFVYDLATFELKRTLEYQGHGWGLCFDGESFWMTNGSATLYRRDPATFAVLDQVRVTRNGVSEWRLNELECAGGYVYANVYETDRIVKVDPATGQVVADIDASGLIPEGGRPRDAGAVLNGIAHDPETDTFYLTGKLWPTVFQVRFVDWPR